MDELITDAEFAAQRLRYNAEFAARRLRYHAEICGLQCEKDLLNEAAEKIDQLLDRIDVLEQLR